MKNIYTPDNYEKIDEVLGRAVFVFPYEYEDDYSEGLLSIVDFKIVGKDGSEISLSTRHPKKHNDQRVLILSVATDYCMIDFENCSFDLSNLNNIAKIEMAVEFEEPSMGTLLIGSSAFPVTFL